VHGALKDLRTEIGHLAPQRDRIRLLFTDHGSAPAPTVDAVEECVELLEDGPLRDRFEVELKRFLATVDSVLPDPAVKPYLADAYLFAQIVAEARRRYRIDDGTFDPSLYGEKVRELIDRHMESLGVDPALPPVSLSSAGFLRQVAAMAGPRARASAGFARRLYATAVTATTRVDFWRKPVDWEDFKGEITGMLIEDGICADDDAMALADALFEVIKASRRRIRHPEAS
jgi:hypothetical protein